MIYHLESFMSSVSEQTTQPYFYYVIYLHNLPISIYQILKKEKSFCLCTQQTEHTGSLSYFIYMLMSENKAKTEKVYKRVQLH